jgi:hypothetical protein
MTAPNINNFLFGNLPVAAGQQTGAIQPTQFKFDPNLGANRENPFLKASLNPAAGDIGVNKPLDKPMFLGYKGNKALYGGSRLFILS